MKFRCDILVAVAMSLEKKTADRYIRNSETGRTVSQDCKQKMFLTYK